MKTPLAHYKMETNSVVYENIYDVVWAAILYFRFKVEVTRPGVNKSAGTLTVYDSFLYDAEIFSEDVTLSYGAPFGPDVIDIQIWQARVCEIVDTI